MKPANIKWMSKPIEETKAAMKNFNPKLVKIEKDFT